MTTTLETQAVAVALDIARDLARHGVPVFVAKPAFDDAGEWLPDGGHGKCGYWLPKGWETTPADPATVDAWRPGDALSAVMGHGIDGVDVDPRHGGDETAAQWQSAGMWPLSLGRQSSPSGGWHDLVNRLGVHSLDDALTGVDVKAGAEQPDANGKHGRGFLFIAPTVKLSKATGEIGRYEWTAAPMLDELDPLDDSGAALAERITAKRAPTVEQVDAPHDAWDALDADKQRAVTNYLAATIRRIKAELVDVLAWPEGYRDERHRGWQKALADPCNRIGRLARADWSPWTLAEAEAQLRAIVPAPIATAIGFDATWAAHRGRRSPAPWPAMLDAVDNYVQSLESLTSVSNATDAGDADAVHGGQVRLAYRLAASHGDRLMFVNGIGWHHWDGARWAEDDRSVAQRAVIEVLRLALSDSISDKELRRDVARCETDTGIRGILAIAAALEQFAHTVADLDADAYLVNCANGTLDLRTMEVRPHDPRDRITKVTRGAYRPDTSSQEWETFLATVLPDEAVRGYFQRLIGLSLLGRVVEHIFTIATGTGANGKGTSYGAILYALGDYGHVAESDLFMQAKSNPNSASPAQMGLLGKRLIVVSETERDHRLAVALMKNLTGGDPITARPLYGKPVTFAPSHTSLMVTNHLPKVAGDDPAAWRRIRVVPFDVVIPESERDGRLGERLELDADAILAWAVEGYRDYEKRGMDAPEAVTVATGNYLKASDDVARFLDECCLINPHMFASIGDLFDRWLRWAPDDGAEPLSKRAFGEALDTHGLPTKRGAHGKRVRSGVGLAADEDSDGEKSW